jgi:hypothetical protein
MTMLPKTLFAAASACLAAAGPGVAQDGPIASARAVAVDAQIRDYLDSAPAPLAAEPERAAADAGGAVRDRAPHGEVGIGVGTGGYRHVHAATVVPVGKIGTAAVAVSDTRINGPHGPYKQQSLSIGVALGEGAAPPADGRCADALRVPRELDPVWVTRMRARQLAAEAACRSGPQR